MSSACASSSFTRASARLNQPARSTSGNSFTCPDRGGHSIENVLLASRGRVEVALPAPGRDDLAGLLPDRAELDERVTHDRRRRAQLLLELAQRNLERLLAGLDLALGDRPGAIVLPRPERPARMDEQHLDPVAAAAVEEEARALLRRHREVSRRRTVPRRRGSAPTRQRGTARPEPASCSANWPARR